MVTMNKQMGILTERTEIAKSIKIQELRNTISEIKKNISDHNSGIADEDYKNMNMQKVN